MEFRSIRGLFYSQYFTAYFPADNFDLSGTTYAKIDKKCEKSLKWAKTAKNRSKSPKIAQNNQKLPKKSLEIGQKSV